MSTNGLLMLLAVIGVPASAFVLGTYLQARRAVRLLTGEEDLEGDGVLPRLRIVETQTETHQRALEAEGLVEPATDGGHPRDDGGG